MILALRGRGVHRRRVESNGVVQDYRVKNGVSLFPNSRKVISAPGDSGVAESSSLVERSQLPSRAVTVLFLGAVKQLTLRA